MGVKKYFIAIAIPMPLSGAIAAVKQDLFKQHHLKGALRSPSHITLHRPFEWKEEKEAALIEKLSSFKFNKPFTVEVKDFAFFEPRVIYADVLPNETLSELHNKLTGFARRELKLFNEAEDERGFHPHITVAFRDLKKPLFYELQPVFARQKIEGKFNCAQICLLRLEEKWEVYKEFDI